MLDDVINVLTEIIIKEHIKQDNDKYILTKQELARFCIKVIKEVQRVYE